MLDRAQEGVCVRKLRALALRDEVALCQTSKRDERVRRVKPGIFAAVRELKRLRDELNLAYAAAPELDVVAERLLAAKAVYLLLREPNVLKRARDRFVPSIDTRANFLVKACKERLRASGCARAYQSL